MGTGAKVLKALRLDGWSNLLSSLGVAGKDKRVTLDWNYDKMSETEVETLYASDDIASKFVDELPCDALREWIEFLNMDSELKDACRTKLDQIGSRARLEEGWSWGRMYGGAGVYMNVNDGRDPQDPVDESAIQDVTSLTVLSRYELIPYQINSNLESPYFGEPAIYRLQTSQPTDFVQRYIHHSRILRFDGHRLPRRLRIQNQWWGQSVFVKSLESIKNYHTAHNSSVAALADFSTGVFKIKNLAELLASGQEAAVRTRIEVANLSKSVIRALVIDGEESFEHVNRQLTGVKDIVDQASSRLVTSSQMPHTKLLGEGPGAGLSGKGESETRDWYDFVKNQQKIVLKPRLDTLIRYVMLSKKGPTAGVIPDGWSYEFVSLWQPTDAERADSRLKTSQADSSDILAGILDANEVAESRYGGEKYSMDTKLNKDLRSKIGAPAPKPTPKLNESASKTVDPAQDPYQQPQGDKNGKDKAVQTPNPGFVSRTDDSDGIVQDNDKRVLQSVVVSKKHGKDIGSAKNMAEEFGGSTENMEESTDSWRFHNRDAAHFDHLKSFVPPKPGVTMIFGKLKDSEETTTNEPKFEQSNKNWQALWSWDETPNCGPDGAKCPPVQQ